MKAKLKYLLIALFSLGAVSCVSTKKYAAMQENYERDLAATNSQLQECTNEKNGYIKELTNCKTTLEFRQEQIADLKETRDRQITQVGDLAVLSQSANENINKTLGQMEQKDQYIRRLHSAKSKADSINLALALNLKSVLREGIEDEDVEIKVDKTVVFINISDKMLYQSGSFKITDRAHEVLGKIAQIIDSRPELEVMVEGYTDDEPINTQCIQDNWDLSVKRATSVVRVLQENYNIDPNRLIAAGRGEFNALASNETDEGKAKNRRTRIIIMPKLNQFYDLLNPDLAANKNKQ